MPEKQEPGSERVLPEPQFSLVTVLRPFTNFEDVYDTKDGTAPIMFTEGGSILDPQAGQPGYDSTLLVGLTVPMGARIILWFPSPGSNILFGPYVWTLIWRLRNTHDYRLTRVSYHYPKMAAGVPRTGPGAGPRVVLPCAMQSVVITSSGPRVGPLGAGTSATNLQKNLTDYAVHDLCVEAVRPKATRFQYTTLATSMLPPPFITANTTGIIEQGVVDANDDSIAEHGMPMFLPFETYCMGDELLLACMKDQTVNNDIDGNDTHSVWKPTWDFKSAHPSDKPFSRLFGRSGLVVEPDVGIYVIVGAVT